MIGERRFKGPRSQMRSVAAPELPDSLAQSYCNFVKTGASSGVSRRAACARGFRRLYEAVEVARAAPRLGENGAQQRIGIDFGDLGFFARAAKGFAEQARVDVGERIAVCAGHAVFL